MDTRTRIQEVALELFTEHGYEKTSLREVAERLGVTKAALYYHFKSKEEIVNSFVEDRILVMDELIRWAESQPPGVELRRTVLTRYADDLFGRNRFAVMRFFEQNQTVLKNLPAGLQMRDRLMRVARLLAGPDQSAENEVRAALAIFAVHSTFFAMRPEMSAQDRHDVALKVAFELLDRIAEVEAETEKVDAGRR